jgi:hypothetical protein
LRGVPVLVCTVRCSVVWWYTYYIAIYVVLLSSWYCI